MKKLLLIFICLPLIGFGQYSNYYNVNANINKNVNVSGTVNKNINVSGNVNKTVTTIDYGALANANAIREQNRLASLQYANEREKMAVLEIANDPSKAYDYGTDNDWKIPRKTRKSLGWGKSLKYFYHKIPHTSLFLRSGSGYTYENISQDGVKTIINISVPLSFAKIREDSPDFHFNHEEYLGYNNFIAGEVYEGSFLHKKDIGRAKVAGIEGFYGTQIFEDKYEKVIYENYVSIGSLDDIKYWITAEVTYKGDKDEVTFEQLEGRRYYFKSLIAKMISTILVH